MTKSLEFKCFKLLSSLCCGYVMAKPKTMPCQNATSCINANSCINVMKYWVEDIGFDGFRADVTGFVPLDFWQLLRPELDAIKPLFMLSEWETCDLHAKAFDATYGWSWYEAAHQIA